MVSTRDLDSNERHRRQLPIHWLVALAVAALVITLGVGNWFIVKGLREAERQNAENLRQTEQAATEIRALIRGAGTLLDREIPLAQRCAAATKQTASLIGDSRRTVATSIVRANEAAGVLHEISGSVSDIAGLVTQIATASQEQAVAIGRINEGLAAVNAITQQTSDVALQNASSSMELSRQADELQRIVSQFRLKEAA